MKQSIRMIKVADLYNGYKDRGEEGVVGYNGALDIRPPYQREFVYKDKQRDAVIDTITEHGCLNLFTWAKREDGTYEVLDGQQRTLSICQYIAGNYSIDGLYFHTLPKDKQNEILNYEIIVNIVEGTASEKLGWFHRINISGEKLTEQELRNSAYVGSWLEDAKKKFSKTNCVAYKLAEKYVKGSPIRQEYLETALEWISDKENSNIEEYMSKHQLAKNANELWLYFSGVIEWVKTTFGENNYRKEMLGLNWGKLYETYKGNSYDATELEARVKALMENEEVTDKKGIYEYVLSGEDESIAKKLSKRAFSKSDMRTIYERQNGICPICGKHHEFNEMEGDHIIPWWRGGKTTIDNLQMLCKKCNSGKGGKMKTTNPNVE